MTSVSLLGYHLTFDAEMGSSSDMSQFLNTFENGDTTLWNNHEAENYAPYTSGGANNPFSFAGGALTINATPTPLNGLPYTSGLIDTAGIFSQNQGYFEIRAETPSAQGFWPAFWMLPNGEGYPEIDILEQPNNSGTDTEYWTHTSTPTDSSGGFSDTGVDVASGFHTYGFMWTANTIQYTFDGQYIGTAHPTPPALQNIKMYLLANLAVGGAGSWPGQPVSGAASTYTIDYIRAFSNDPTVPAVSQEPISSPDSANTTPVLALPTPPTPPTIGVGPDTLLLNVAEDSYQGDAQFTISIDGKQFGGVQTALADHASGQTQAFAVQGHFGSMKHTVTVNFLNDAGGAPGADRNLYVTGARIDGTPIANSALGEYGSGPQSFNFKGDSPAEIVIGAGPDTVLFDVSELRAGVNARFAVFVDKVQQGTVQPTTALQNYGQTQMVAVKGKFGATAHTVRIVLANGSPVGSSTQGPSLTISNLSFNGASPADNSATLTTRGSAVFTTPPASPFDTLTIGLSEDAYNGDAKAQISLDGTVLGSPTITFLHSQGQSELLTYTGHFGGASATHSLTVNFLNDAYTQPGEDRNLYVDTINFDGTAYDQTQELRVGGPVSFTLVPPTFSGSALQHTGGSASSHDLYGHNVMAHAS